MISAFYQSTKVTLKQCKCGDADKQFLNVHILGDIYLYLFWIFIERPWLFLFNKVSHFHECMDNVLLLMYSGTQVQRLREAALFSTTMYRNTTRRME